MTKRQKTKLNHMAVSAAMLIGEGCSMLNGIGLSVEDKKEMAHDAVEMWFDIVARDTDWDEEVKTIIE